MLKKSVAILLILMYFSTVSGFALNLHYCFNRLSSIKIDAPAKPCVKKVAVPKMKCCSDKRIEIKVKDAHQAGIKSSLSRIFNIDIPFILFGNIFVSLPYNYTAVVPYRGPPDALHSAPIFLQNCTFRI